MAASGTELASGVEATAARPPTLARRPVLLGNFMRPNPVIAAELRRFQLAGVPLLLVYPRAAAQSPLVLPASRTSSTALGALNAVAK